MLNLEDKGLHNVSCCFGTHQFTPDNVSDKFSPFIISGTKFVVILLDNDASGDKAAKVLSRMIRDKTRLTPIVANYLLPGDKDPGDLTKEEVDTLSKHIELLVADLGKD